MKIVKGAITAIVFIVLMVILSISVIAWFAGALRPNVTH